MSRSKEVKGMMTVMAENAEDLSVKEDSEVKKLETLQVKEVERLKLREEVSCTLKSAEVEVEVEVEAKVTLAEVLEWLVADPEVLNVLILMT